MSQGVINGSYEIIQTSPDMKLLYLDATAYLWRSFRQTGTLTRVNESDRGRGDRLDAGIYSLFEDAVRSETLHLILNSNHAAPVSYLLPHGLPLNRGTRTQILEETNSTPKAAIFSFMYYLFTPIKQPGVRYGGAS